MATDLANRVRPSNQRADRGVLGSCVRVFGTPRSTTVTVRLAAGGRVEVDLPAAPDPVLARRLTSGYRHLSWVSIDTTGDGVHCTLAGVSRRPRRSSLPLAAALALADDAVPTLVRLRRSVA